MYIFKDENLRLLSMNNVIAWFLIGTPNPPSSLQFKCSVPGMFLKCLCEFRSRNCQQHHTSTTLDRAHELLSKEKCAGCILLWTEWGSGHTTSLLFLLVLRVNLLFPGSEKLTTDSRMNNFENLSCLLFIEPFINYKHFIYAFLIYSKNDFPFNFILLEKFYYFIISLQFRNVIRIHF